MVRNVWIAIVAIVMGATIAWGDAPATRPAPVPRPATNPANAPTYITLHVKNAMGGDVLKEISQQAHAHVVGWPDFFWSGRQAGVIPQITLNLDHVTFWSAIEAICNITHSHPQYIGQASNITLAMGNPGKWDQEGLFAFVPTGISRISTVDLINGHAQNGEAFTFVVYVDPKIHASHWDVPQVTLAEDEHGNSLLVTGPNQPAAYPQGNQSPWIKDFSIPLKSSADFGKTIARLEGTVRVELSRVDELQIKDLDKSVGSHASVANRKVEVLACHFDGKNTISLHLQISAQGKDAKPTTGEDLIREFNSARVVDAAGQQIAPDGQGTGSDSQIDWTGTFTARRPPKPPFMLHWSISTDMEPLTVGFKFKDLSLPPR